MITANRWERLFSTTIIYYFMAGLLLFFSIDVPKVKVNRLNCLGGFASYPVKYLGHTAPFQERQFRYTRKYYQTLINLIPRYEKSGLVNGPVTLSRTYAMIALCDYYLGRNKEAVELFKKALTIEPRHFWFSYNLGVIYFRLGDDAAAISYLNNFFSADKEKLEASMRLDNDDFREPALAEKYRQVSSNRFYDAVVNSYKLAILASERLKNPVDARNLSLIAIQSGLGNKDNFFYYYAGLISQKPAVGDELFDLMVVPSLYFMPIGQENHLARRR